MTRPEAGLTIHRVQGSVSWVQVYLAIHGVQGSVSQVQLYNKTRGLTRHSRGARERERDKGKTNSWPSAAIGTG